jgi:predicted nucleic acid-binding protein
MIVITDSNIIFSALINPTGKEAIILKSKGRIQFIAPGFLLEEIREHWNSIEKFSVSSKFSLQKEFKILKSRIKVVNIDNIPHEKLMEAYKIVKDIDEEDTYFVALFLFKKHKIWTGDKQLINGLKAKGYDICITTEELRKMLYKKD